MESYMDCWSRGLPTEIILKIFRYLDFSDLQAISATCVSWRAVLLYHEFLKNVQVKISRVCFSDRLTPASVFVNSQRPFRNFYFEEVTFGQVAETIAHIGKNIESVIFDNADLSDRQFYGILAQLQNLRELTIIHCSPLFMSGSFLENHNDRMAVEKALNRIKKLSLRWNEYLTDAILVRLATLIDNLESLDMSGCHISYHNAIQRRFYPEGDNALPSSSILTFKFVCQVLERHQHQLRELNFSNTMIGAQATARIMEIGERGLQLQRLYLSECPQLNAASIKTLLQTQPNLMVLNLSNTGGLNDDCVEILVMANPKIEEINFAGCSGLTNIGAVFLGKLKFLKRLDISRCDNVNSPGITQGIAQTHNEMLEELQMASLNVCEECIKCIAQNLKQLRVLNLKRCGNGVTDEAMQCIIENLKSLKELTIEDCFRLTDAALTGINVSKLQSEPSTTSPLGSNRSLQNFHPPPSASIVERDFSSPFMKISLRSKAEEEIVRDANRKKAMFAACELNLIEESDIIGHSIQQLRNLKCLNVKGCNKITDVSLKYGLKFISLQKLCLSNCQQISLIGMESLVVNCPSIEELDLSDCYNINDKAIQAVTIKLKRLKSLNISGCTQLTDHSLDAILVNCKILQTLSVYRCRRMYTDIEERLGDMPTLRNLHMDHTNNIDNAEIFRLKKRLDY